MVAALYVQRGGVYYDLADVEPWGLPDRDAREYAGPWPVVAHPPCERWGRYWSGGPSPRAPRRRLGDDGGCFAAALEAVRRFGGVLEHPEASHAWRHFGLNLPPFDGGWINADFCGGWTCRVDQGHYGHQARKSTWLYACGVRSLPSLRWDKAEGKRVMDDGFHSTAERRAARAAGVPRLKRLSDRERAATPIPFRDLLISIARAASAQKAA